MTSTAIVTMAKMMETLPEPVQNQVVEHLRDYVAEIQDEIQWDILFNRTQEQLIAAAQRARQEIAAGHAEPLDYEQL
jgi:hypothetical protein